ncbi:MAG: enoyl-CoA hydratase/isomerase family protein [Chloroflexi bacterium]|nr:enoyl-CoA hydratase/isomerase family protein [Chloroflexota bacterium]
MAYDYKLLHVTREGAALWATIDNPPVNVMTLPLYQELMGFAAEVAADDSVLAVVLQSADPDFFIAHFDVEVLLRSPIGQPIERSETLNAFHEMCQTFRNMPKATICKIAGRVGGGGSELSSSCDMRFGLLGKTVMNQMEVPIGILPGGTGTQRLPRMMGRGRALEIILGGVDLDAATAERWGWLNRAFATAAELDAYVDGLARRIASFPPLAVRNGKAAAGFAEPDPVPGMLEEAYLFQEVLRTQEAHDNMQRFMDLGGQTRAGELRVAELSGEVARGD